MVTIEMCSLQPSNRSAVMPLYYNAYSYIALDHVVLLFARVFDVWHQLPFPLVTHIVYIKVQTNMLISYLPCLYSRCVALFRIVYINIHPIMNMVQSQCD
ncbi:hypothetical protein BDB01DRAFT_783307 [Pilobolus umbonatus]|nr:hypothetical protein BDB01DRAFT_783307 [Pilobolus umbonatus]